MNPFKPAHSALVPVDLVKRLHKALPPVLAAELATLAGGDYTDDERAAAKRYQDAAQRQSRDGEVEVDPGASVSLSSDGGAYVQAWVWVSDKDLT